jgi:hypothetical protein
VLLLLRDHQFVLVETVGWMVVLGRSSMIYPFFYYFFGGFYILSLIHS